MCPDDGLSDQPLALEMVFEVTAPIPEWGAVPGDFLIYKPADPDCPFVLRRPLPLYATRVLDTAAVTMLLPVSVAGGARARRRCARRRAALRLVS